MATKANTNAATKTRIGATILMRDGYTCQYVSDTGTHCARTVVVGGSPTDGYTFNRGHVVSDCNGGDYSVSNLVTLCRRCNAQAGGDDMRQANIARDLGTLDTPLVSLDMARGIMTGETNMERLD